MHNPALFRRQRNYLLPSPCSTLLLISSSGALSAWGASSSLPEEASARSAGAALRFVRATRGAASLHDSTEPLRL